MSSLLVADLDGTYLDETGRVAENSSMFHDFLKQSEIAFAVGTSRSAHNVSRLLRHIDRFLGICSDGGLTVEFAQGEWKILREGLIDPTLAHSFLQWAEHSALSHDLLVFYGADGKFLIEGSAALARVPTIAEVLLDLADGREVTWRAVRDASALLQKSMVRAFSWFECEERIRLIESQIRASRFSDLLTVMMYEETRRPGFWWLDAISLDCNKGYALRCLRSEFPISYVVALGNGENDLSLFRESDLSIAPSNATDSLKLQASIVTNSSCGAGFLDEVMTILTKELGL